MLLAWSVERLFLRRAKYWGQHPVFGWQEQDIYLYWGGGMYLYVNEHMRGHMCGGQGTNLLFFLRGVPL